MASVNKNNIRRNLENALREELRTFAENMVKEAKQEITDNLRKSINQYSEKQAKNLAKAIVDGLDDVFDAINDNTNKINSLQITTNNITS